MPMLLVAGLYIFGCLQFGSSLLHPPVGVVVTVAFVSMFGLVVNMGSTVMYLESRWLWRHSGYSRINEALLEGERMEIVAAIGRGYGIKVAKKDRMQLERWINGRQKHLEQLLKLIYPLR